MLSRGPETPNSGPKIKQAWEELGDAHGRAGREHWLSARPHTQPPRAGSAAGPQPAGPTSTLPPQSLESTSPWQQPEKGPAKIFMAQNSPEAPGRLMSSLLSLQGR